LKLVVPLVTPTDGRVPAKPVLKLVVPAVLKLVFVPRLAATFECTAGADVDAGEVVDPPLTAVVPP